MYFVVNEVGGVFPFMRGGRGEGGRAYALRGERGGWCLSIHGRRGGGHMHFVVNKVGGVFPFMEGGGRNMQREREY